MIRIKNTYKDIYAMHDGRIVDSLQVRIIKRLKNDFGMTAKQISEIFNVGTTTCYDIANGKRYIE